MPAALDVRRARAAPRAGSGTTRALGLVAGLAAFGLGTGVRAQDFGAARIETQEIGEGLYVLYAVGGGVVAGNIAASLGDDGILLVDDQFPEMAPKYEAAIRNVGGRGDIAFVINTHWHFDHTDANATLARSGTRFVSQENSRVMMMRDVLIDGVTFEREQPARPPIAWPVITYDRSMRMHFNGHRIDLLHFGSAHTAGDTVVIFRDLDIVHLGDVFNTSAYPFIDAGNGGSLSGIIDSCEAVLAQIDERATVIPGHGRVSDYAGLAAYVEMLRTIRDRIAALIDTGAGLEQVVAARPTAEWDAANGDPAAFLDRAYTSMTR